MFGLCLRTRRETGPRTEPGVGARPEAPPDGTTSKRCSRREANGKIDPQSAELLATRGRMRRFASKSRHTDGAPRGAEVAGAARSKPMKTAYAPPPLTTEPLGWPRRLGVERIIGTSTATVRLRETVRKVAQCQAMTVLLQGESGTGKDLVAQALHEESDRARGPYLPINCSAIPENLMEAEFFGHEAGAYTDARQSKPGLFELAHQGAVLLDEVAEIPLGVQAKFLRFLEDRRFKRLGGTTDLEVDVRIIAGTNVDLAGAVRTGRFRADLYYRLGVVQIAVAPLRERPEDIPPLARFFLDHYGRRLRKRFEEFAPEAMRRLVLHSWPGNVRELKNAIERIVLLEEGPVVLPDMLILADRAAPRSPPRRRWRTCASRMSSCGRSSARSSSPRGT